MKIKKAKGRECWRLLARVGFIGVLLFVFFSFFSVERIEGDDLSPNYKDGDLVLRNKVGNETYLLLRIRGFDD